MSKRNKLSVLSIGIGAFLGGILLATTGANFVNRGDVVGAGAQASTMAVQPPNARAGTTVEPSASVQSLEDSFTQVAELVGPSVVQIRSERVQKIESQGNPFEGTPFEDFLGRDFGNRNVPEEFRSNALGSGVIVSQDGYIATNNHVVEEMENLEVKLFDGSFHDATVVGRDPSSDLAVIKIDVSGLHPISYGDHDNVRVGQWVLAFGSPLSADLDNTVTAGIVSAVQRSGSSLRQVNALPAFIQTDAAINPGNSGGALVNTRGELIGINSAILSRSGGSQGIGFAIPANIVRNVVTQLIEGGEVRRGYLGIGFGPVSPALAKAYNVSRAAAQIASVEPGQAAEKAGLRQGDLIVRVDDRELKDFNELSIAIANRMPGDKVKLSIIRDSNELSVPVTLGLRPDEETLAGRMRAPLDKNPSAEEMKGLGLKLADLSEQTIRSMGLPASRIPSGVIITEIEQNSDAYRDAELRRGDIITAIDKKVVANRAEFEAAYGKIKSGETFIVRVQRFTNQVDQTFITALVKP